MDGDVHLGRATLVRARAQPVADHLLEPADGRLGASPRRVAGRFLPGRPPVFGDALQVTVPLRGRSWRRFRRRSRWKASGGAVSAVSLGTAVDRGGTMIAASGWRSATAVETPSWS